MIAYKRRVEDVKLGDLVVIGSYNFCHKKDPIKIEHIHDQDKVITFNGQFMFDKGVSVKIYVKSSKN